MKMKVWPAAAVLLVLAAVLAGAGADKNTPVLRIERSVTNASAEQLVIMDKKRHALTGLLEGVVHLPVIGTGYSYPSMTGGPYLTRVQLGTPPRNFSVLIDTGSPIPWVNCHTPGVQELTSQQVLFDPNSSSTSSLLACSDNRCQDMVHTGYAVCGKSNNVCEFNLRCGPGFVDYSQASGYYISDMAQFEVLEGTSQKSSTIVPLVFGCSTLNSGELAMETFDGIFGFGRHTMSFSAQLHYLGLSLDVFTLCMKSSEGGGILVFGEILEPGIVYTPLVSSLGYYELIMKSISVNGQELPIQHSVFNEQKTFADSGTTMAYLADGVFDPFVDAIAAAVSPHARSVENNGDRCFTPTTSYVWASVDFPTLTLYFANGAAMKLKPNNYLYSHDQIMYCIAWKKTHGKQVTILGDIVLMDKILVHDLMNMQFGWKDFDCSRSVNVVSSTMKKPVTSGDISHKVSILAGVVIMLMHIFIFCAI